VLCTVETWTTQSDYLKGRSRVLPWSNLESRVAYTLSWLSLLDYVKLEYSTAWHSQQRPRARPVDRRDRGRLHCFNEDQLLMNGPQSDWQRGPSELSVHYNHVHWITVDHRGLSYALIPTYTVYPVRNWDWKWLGARSCEPSIRSCERTIKDHLWPQVCKILIKDLLWSESARSCKRTIKDHLWPKCVRSCKRTITDHLWAKCKIKSCRVTIDMEKASGRCTAVIQCRPLSSDWVRWAHTGTTLYCSDDYSSTMGWRQAVIPWSPQRLTSRQTGDLRVGANSTGVGTRH